MQHIYNYIPETNRVSRVYNVAAVLYLQFALHIIIIISSSSSGGGGGSGISSSSILAFLPRADITISSCLGLKPILSA